MQTKYDNLLAGKDQTIRALWVMVLLAFCTASFAGVGWLRSPKDLLVHLPPDISNGAVMSPGKAGRPNVYAFAYYVWQQMNRWESDGAVEYDAKIHGLRHYLTPSCYQNRLDDYAHRKTRHEIDSRARAVWELPGRGYDHSRVEIVADGQSWIVYLDLHIRETMMGENIKDRFVNYPIKVVKHPVDPTLNAFGLAVDCLADIPRVIEGVSS